MLSNFSRKGLRTWRNLGVMLIYDHRPVHYELDDSIASPSRNSSPSFANSHHLQLPNVCISNISITTTVSEQIDFDYADCKVLKFTLE